MQLVKQSTASNVPLKVFLASDHVTAATGKTLTVTLSKDGAAFGAAGASVTEISSGWYKIALTTTDANTLGTLVVRATAALCDDAEVVCLVVADLPGATVSSVTGAVGSVTGAVGSVTAAVTVGTINANVITATSINAAALNGKGDWLLSSSYTAAPTAAAVATTVWQDLTAGADFATANSIGALLKTYTTADTSGTTTLLARLTAGRATNLDNLDAAVSTRSTYAGADTAGTTTLLARLPSALTVTAGKVDVNDKTGFALTSTGLNLVLVDGMTLPVAVQYVAAAAAGKASGAGTGTEVFKGLDGLTTRITATVDASGNRTAITYG